ncbi:acyl-CoA-binding domain-containing protein 6 [Aricia agestis]|uniref:acyl-CoA-binding domain-containing protein 6 n=1 Tax=Aricia agestis TaxID=91739 RepID=UPI001C206EF4|nr:acyl-CoA-binding domain-containing protein 6 [Aricia agestis]
MAEAWSNSCSDFSDDDQSPLDISFNKASDHVRKITSKLDNNQLLELYGLFKQSTEGKCESPKPSWFDQKGRRKWEAWKALEEMPQDEAKAKYVEAVKKYDSEFETGDAPKGGKESWVAVSTLRRDSEPELVHEELDIFEAARENLPDRIEELVRKNPELLVEKDKDGLTALHWAADRDSTDALAFLINAGTDLNAPDESGQTALHYAALCGHVKATKMLIDAQALLVADHDGSTPLDLATEEEVRTILEHAPPLM